MYPQGAGDGGGAVYGAMLPPGPSYGYGAYNSAGYPQQSGLFAALPHLL